MPIKMNLIMLSIAIAFGTGGTLGAYAVWKIWNISTLIADNRKLREDAERVKKVLSINQKTDDITAAVEKDNELVLQEIARLQEEAFKQPAIAKGSKDEDSASSYVCVDSQRMRSIGKLR